MRGPRCRCCPPPGPRGRASARSGTCWCGRALDATVWLAAVNQAAPDPQADPEAPTKAPTGVGHSALIGPDGTVRGQLGDRPDLLVGDVDTEETSRVRRAVAVLDNRSL